MRHSGRWRSCQHEELWRVLGSHVQTYDSPFGPITGTSFAVWAPHAQGVRIKGDELLPDKAYRSVPKRASRLRFSQLNRLCPLLLAATRAHSKQAVHVWDGPVELTMIVARLSAGAAESLSALTFAVYEPAAP